MISLNMRTARKYFMLIPVMLIGCIQTDLIDDPQVKKGKLKINLSQNSVFVNDSLKLSASFFSYSGDAVSGNTVTWFSSNRNIAEVNQSGYIFGVNTGQTWIYAAAENFEKDSLLITVVNDSSSVSSVKINGGVTNISTGQTLQLQAEAYNFKGNKLNNVSFKWTSSDNGVLSVNAAGLVLAVSPGLASITVQAGNVSSSPLQITVTGSIRTGKFEKNPSQDHVVSGGAILRENKDGSLTLEFDSTFASSGGPDVRVYLSGSQSISGNSFEVAPLKSTSGKQSYDLPLSVKINSYDWVLIHCVPFNITFGWAKLN